MAADLAVNIPTTRIMLICQLVSKWITAGKGGFFEITKPPFVCSIQKGSRVVVVVVLLIVMYECFIIYVGFPLLLLRKGMGIND